MEEWPASTSAATSVQSPVADDEWGELGRRLQFLRRVKLFHNASRDLLVAVATALRPLNVLAGGVVCRQNEPAGQFYLVDEGTLAVRVDLGGTVRELARLGPGQFFGEIALLTEGQRSATVRAETAAKLWTLSREDFAALLQREPRLEAAVRQTAQARQMAGGRNVFEVEHRNLAALAQGSRQVRIGRGPENDLVFASRLVSRNHAVVEAAGDGYRLRDLDSANGTYVNRKRIQDVLLADGDEIWVADERFVFDRREIQQCVEPAGLRVDVNDLTREVKGGKQLLQDISLSILPGEFVAIVGGSGAGKTTLLDAISGVRPPTSGSVRYNGADYYRNQHLYRQVLGYVPQDDIIHKELKLRSTLRYAAKLRLPPDTSDEDIDGAIDEALKALSLTAQADLPVESLSGGQRKRASIGVELLTRPRIFFLDEPTSGLDPYTDAQMMQLMRRIADEGSTVLLTTHATKNVALCDKVIVLARGGYLAFVGSPNRALRYFECASFDEIYGRLADEGTPGGWAQQFRDSDDYTALLADQTAVAEPKAEPGRRHALGEGGAAGAARRQFLTLWRRNVELLLAHPKALIPLVMQPIGIGFMVFLVFQTGLFGASTDNPRTALSLLFFLTLGCFFFGVSDGLDEIVRESSVFRRERMVGLSVGPYVLSKMMMLAPIPLIQGALVVLVVALGQRLPTRGIPFYAPFVVNLWLTEFAALALALLTSSLVSTSAQGVRLIPVLAVPQLLLAGQILPVRSMGIVGRALSQITIVKWSFEAAGHISDLNGLFASVTSPAGSSIAKGLQSEYANTFGQSVLGAELILVAFTIWPLVAACLVLKRKTASR